MPSAWWGTCPRSAPPPPAIPRTAPALRRRPAPLGCRHPADRSARSEAPRPQAHSPICISHDGVRAGHGSDQIGDEAALDHLWYGLNVHEARRSDVDPIGPVPSGRNDVVPELATWRLHSLVHLAGRDRKSTRLNSSHVRI